MALRKLQYFFTKVLGPYFFFGGSGPKFFCSVNAPKVFYAVNTCSYKTTFNLFLPVDLGFLTDLCHYTEKMEQSTGTI